VILLDANLLIYAHVSSFPQHAPARSWLDAQLNGSGPVGLPWPSLVAFLRIVTNPRVFERPEPMADAWRQVHTWLEADVVWIPQPTERHREVLETLLTTADVQANLVPYAHLTALAIEHGLLLCSTDGDFGRFTDLRWQNPLAGTASRR
jgi:toxin-antitoxin system PIN domain toxin